MTYEYMCTDCGHAWEAEQSISEAPLRSCPSCKHDTAKRQVSGGAGFILKGGGWYADLYSSAGGSSGKKSGGDGSGDSGTGSKSSDSGTSSSSSGSSGSSDKGSAATPAA